MSIQELVNLVRSGDVQSVKTFLSSHQIDLHRENRKHEVSPLMVACKSKDIEMVKILLEGGAQVDFESKDGWTALMKAAEGESVQVVKLLLERGANIDSKSRDGQCALTVACKQGSIELVKALLQDGAAQIDPKKFASSTESGLRGFSYVLSPVNVAASHGNVDLVKWLLESGVEIPFGALLLAIARQNSDMVKLLLQHGADANSTEKYGCLALMLASVSGKVSIVKALLEQGAKVNHQDQKTNFALMMATTKGHYEVIELLLKAGAQVNMKDEKGFTALMQVVMKGYGHGGHAENRKKVAMVVELLLDGGADVNLQNGAQNTALLLADKYAPEIVKLLLDRGAQINHKNRRGDYALKNSISPFGRIEVAKVLLEAGAKIDLQDHKGKHVLMDVCGKPHRDHREKMKLLLDYGAPVNLQDNDGRNALLYEVNSANRDYKYVELLLEKGANPKSVPDTGSSAFSVLRGDADRILAKLGSKVSQYPRLQSLLMSKSQEETVSEVTPTQDGTPTSGAVADPAGGDVIPDLVIQGQSSGSNTSRSEVVPQERVHTTSTADPGRKVLDSAMKGIVPMESRTSESKASSDTNGVEIPPGHASESENSPEQESREDEDVFIEDVKEAVVENKSVDRKLAHSILTGPPGSGKSSLMDRLLHRPRKAFSSSTGVSESVVIVDIGIDNPSSFHSVTVVDANTWKEVEYDISLVRQMKERSVDSLPKQGQSDSSEETPSRPTSSTASSVQESAQYEAHSSSKDSVQALAPKTKLSDSDIRGMIDAVIKKCGSLREFQGSYNKSFSLYMRDAGGQMAFQEMLSVLILGPSIFIFVFRVDLDLKKKFNVEYRVSAKESLNISTSSITTEEALLQCLASVYAMDTSGKAGVKTHKPLVFIVGTHKDRLGLSADEKIGELNELLHCLISSSNCFEDLVQYADRDEKEVMFTVDNTSESDEDFERIRSKIYSLVSERSEFSIEYPIRYLLFALELQHEKGSVLSFDECKAIAAKYGIAGDQVSHLLQFLHFRVGVIQYFEVEGIVMIKPQALFSKVTDLVKMTFSCKSLTSREVGDFRKGILTASLIKNVVREDAIDSEKFLQLLIRLHIIAPIITGKAQEEKYFIPCVLNHVQESSDEDLHTDILPMSVQFQCEHFPKGLFGVLVTHLLTPDSEKESDTAFKLIEDKTFRDQVSFEVHSHADQDEVSLRAFPSHLEIKFFPSLSEDRDLPIDKVCSNVRQVIEKTIVRSLQDLHYNEHNAQPVMCFRCEHCSELHQVKKGKSHHKVYCARARTNTRVPQQGRYWFNEVSVASTVPTSSHISSAESKAGDLSSYVSSLPASAHLEQQLDWDHEGVDSDLIEIAHHMLDWEEKLCSDLGLTEVDVHDIKHIHLTNPELQRREALRRWKSNQGLGATYGNLLKLFVITSHAQCAKALCDVLRKKCA